ncbi:MAG TPA: DMT family transporter [Sedimentisphaerales bacterium]|nr:DMT family transporter [Sedimentisphaerales bacterium]
MNDAKRPKLDTSATLASIGALVCWSSGPIFIKLLTGWLDFWTQNTLRYLVASLFWLPFLLVSVRNGRISRGLWLRALLPAAANIVMQCFWGAAFYYLKPAFMILLTQSSIIWIAGFSVAFFPQERPLARSKRFWLGAALSITGVAGVLLFKENFTATRTATGIVIALSAALLWGVYTICAKAAFKNIDSRTGFSVVSLYTFAGLSVLAMAFGRPGDCTRMAVQAWGYVVVSGILSIALSHVLYYFAIKRIGATIPSLVLLLQPVIVLAISSVVFDESLNAFQWVFGAVLLVGSASAILAQQHLNSADSSENALGRAT